MRILRSPQLPINLQRRIVPDHCAFVLGRVKIRRFIEDVSRFRDHAEAVSKAARKPQHAFVLTGKFDGFIFPEGRRAAPQVDRNIENLAGDRANEFALGLANLVVQSANDVLFGKRMIVLHERLTNAEARKGALVVAFQKKSAIIAEYARFEKQKSGKAGRDRFHRNTFID